MRKTQEKLLSSLIKIPSPSGFEDNLAFYIKKLLSNYIPKSKVTIDNHKNVVAIIPGTSNKTVMIDAHLDQLGFIVYNVDKDGYIALEALGGYDLSILRGRKVWIIPENKGRPFEGVISTKHAHLIAWGEERELIPNKPTDLTLDIGIRGRKNVYKYLEIGDPVIIKPDCSHMVDDYYSGAGFDDKAGVYIMIETIKALMRTRKKPIPTLIFTFSSQEEIGCKGAKEMVRRFSPLLYIGIDVTCSTDCYSVEEREAGKCNLGQGMVIIKGVNIHRPSLKLMQSIARINKIKVQYQATAGDECTNASTVANELDGIKILDLGVPCRHLHSPVEVINSRDLNYGIRLLQSFLLSRKLGKVIDK